MARRQKLRTIAKGVLDILSHKSYWFAPREDLRLEFFHAGASAVRGHVRNKLESLTAGKTKFEPILRKEMPELDTIRGLAILGVVIYHGLRFARDISVYPPLQRHSLSAVTVGQFGVQLFFVLSGFLITGLLFDSRDRPGYYRRFYIRRALRILPLYYVILLSLALTRIASPGFLLISFFFCANASQMFGINMSYGVLWSLGVEENFYLLWPTVVHRMSNRMLMAVAGTIVLITPVLRLFCYYHSPKDSPLFDCAYYTWNASDGLACGAFLSLLVREFHSERRPLLIASWVFLIAGAMVAGAGLPFGIVTRMRPVGTALQSTPLNFGFTAMLGFFLLLGTGPLKALVNSRVLRFFGHISYGLYLIHLLVFVGYDRLAVHLAPRMETNLGRWGALWVRFFFAGLAAIAISYLSRRFFEDPFLRLKSRLTQG
jgi:peptidoglycan/LPS O-acetylase OafA/YrhL